MSKKILIVSRQYKAKEWVTSRDASRRLRIHPNHLRGWLSAHCAGSIVPRRILRGTVDWPLAYEFDWHTLLRLWNESKYRSKSSISAIPFVWVCRQIAGQMANRAYRCERMKRMISLGTAKSLLDGDPAFLKLLGEKGSDGDE